MADENLNGLDGIISRLMSDPGIMETVRSAVSEMKLTGEGGDAPKKTDTAPQPGAPDMQSIAALASMLGGTGGGRGGKPPGTAAKSGISVGQHLVPIRSVAHGGGIARIGKSRIHEPAAAQPPG